MYEGLRYKFRAHEQLKVKLLETGERQLIEHTVNDKYWGDGGDGSGKNKLGKLLMKLRSEFREEQESQ